MTTDYIHPIVEINGRFFYNAICGGVNPHMVLANKCVGIDKACHNFFGGTGESFVMNCYEFQILFICYMHLLTHSSPFCVWEKLS